jgi:hypothetical protein
MRSQNSKFVLHCFSSKIIEPKHSIKPSALADTGVSTIYKPSGRTVISQPMADTIETPEME